MPPARSTFWTLTTRFAGGSRTPRKYGLNCCMPATMKSVDGSSAGGISGCDGHAEMPALLVEALETLPQLGGRTHRGQCRSGRARRRDRLRCGRRRWPSAGRAGAWRGAASGGGRAELVRARACELVFEVGLAARAASFALCIAPQSRRFAQRREAVRGAGRGADELLHRRLTAKLTARTASSTASTASTALSVAGSSLSSWRFTRSTVPPDLVDHGHQLALGAPR